MIKIPGMHPPPSIDAEGIRVQAGRSPAQEIKGFKTHLVKPLFWGIGGSVGAVHAGRSRSRLSISIIPLGEPPLFRSVDSLLPVYRCGSDDDRLIKVSAGHSSGDRKCMVSLAMGPSAIFMADGDKQWLAT